MRTPFIFTDGWRFISSDGNSMYITKNELENYKYNNIQIDEIKALCFGYMTGKSFLNFSIEGIDQYYEF